MRDITVMRKPDVQKIIESAIRSGVVVVHIEPTPTTVTIRYRRAGKLQQGEQFSLESGAVLIKQIKRLAKLGVRQKLSPQQGRYETTIDQQAYYIEVVTAPVMDGERVTLHIQTRTSRPFTVQQLGWWGSNLIALQQAITQPHGLIIIAGQQTHHIQATLLAIAGALPVPFDQLVYINEYPIPKLEGIESIVTQPELGRAMSQLLTRFKRTDHQVVLADLLTTRQDMQAAVALAKSGKLLIAGVPSSNATNALIFFKRATRLTSGIVLVRLSTGQLFVPRLCVHCQELYQPDQNELRQLDRLFHFDNSETMRHLHTLENQALQNGVNVNQTALGSSAHGIVRLWRARQGGCQWCHHSGYHGEIGLYEATPVSTDLQQKLTNFVAARALRQSVINNGMLSIEVDGLIKLLRGLIDVPTLLTIFQQ